MTETTYPWQNTSLQDLPGEIWKPITGFKDIYEISNLGRVKSLERTVNTGYNNKRTVRERILKSRLRDRRNNNRYLVQVHLRSAADNIDNYSDVSRLVAFHFIAYNDTIESVVNYKDNNPVNITVDNLKWGRRGANSHKPNRIFT